MEDQLKKATDKDQLKKATGMDEVLKITKFYEFRELSISFTRTHQEQMEETERQFENVFQRIVATADFGKDNTSKMRAPKKSRNTTKTVSSEKLSETTVVGKSSRLRGDKMNSSKKSKTTTTKELVEPVTGAKENEAGEKDKEKDGNNTDNKRKRKNSETSTNVVNVDVDKKSEKPKKGTKKSTGIVASLEHSAQDDNPKPVGMPNAKRIVKKFEQQCKPKTPIKKKKAGKNKVPKDVKYKPRLLTKNAAKLVNEVPKQPLMAQKHDVLSSCENILTNKKGPEQCVHSPVKEDQDEIIRKKEELLRAGIEDIKRNIEAKSQKRAVQKNYEKETVASAAKKITQEEVKHVKAVEQPQVDNEDLKQKPQNQKVENENAGGQQNMCELENYNIDDIESGDSSEDELMQIRVIPGWAERESRFERAKVDKHIPHGMRVTWLDVIKVRHWTTESLISDNSNLTASSSSIF